MSLSSAPSSKRPSLRVQITQIDYTVIQPGSLDNSSLPRVPIIRIFGTSSVGKKTCLHVHQVYPYFYVEYHGPLDANHVNHYISKLVKSLNHAIALSLKRNPLSHGSRYIRAILLVKGIHFYGFHSSYTPFLKVFVADPAYVFRTVTILQSATVMGTRFRIFESHISYVLQFMCDFGLYGCGWIDLEEVLQRDVKSTCEGEYANSDEHMFDSSPYFRQTRMPLEVDAIAPHILNRHSIAPRNLHHKLEIPAAPLPPDPLVLSVRELWEDERKRRAARGLNPSPEIPVDPSDSSRGVGGDWVAEAQYWEELRGKIESDRVAEGPTHLTGEWENWVMTTFDSAEALWEDRWRVWMPASQAHREQSLIAVSQSFPRTAPPSHVSQWNTDIESEPDDNAIDVDISMLSSQDISQLIDLEEGRWASRADRDSGPRLREDDESEDDDVFNDEEEVPEVSQQTSLSDPFQPPEEGPARDPAGEPELRFSSPPFRPHIGRELPSPTTPTRGAGVTPKSLWPSESDSEGEDTASRPVRVLENVSGLAEVSVIDSEKPSTSNGILSEGSPDIGPLDTARPAKRQKLGFSLEDEEIPPYLGNYFSSPSPCPEPVFRPTVPVRKLLKESYAVHTMKTINMNRYAYAMPPPTAFDLLISTGDYTIPTKVYRPPYYSSILDAPDRPKEYGGLTFHLKGGEGVTTLDPWDATDSARERFQLGRVPPLLSRGIGGWEYANSPPSVKEVKRWLSQDSFPALRGKMKSQIEGPIQANIFGLKETPRPALNARPASRERQAMSVLSLEVFAPTEDNKTPNPDINEIAAVFYAYQMSEAVPPEIETIVIQAPHFDPRRMREMKLNIVQDEIELINHIVDIVGNLDPDVITGWDIQRGSWGYLDARGKQNGFEISDLISRAPSQRSAGSDQWGMRHTSTFKVAGRHVLNLWRIMRSEQALTSYTLENVTFSVLGRRIPRYSNGTLSDWYHSGVPSHTSCALRYFLDRTCLLLDILEQSEVLTKTAEFARVFGVDFFSVISRGSQFKVESFMFRIAKPESFVLISPNKKDVGKQNAAECMPLIMEPASAFYSSPLVVLDFQSLYPSIMIAYNYCYSTCLGRIKDFQGRNKFGVVDLELPPGLLSSLSEHIQVAPNGMIYVKPEVRKGLLGRMLIELLGTRVMVKQAMKGVKNDKALRRVLDARQLGLKYIANVTYGYTSASFSGRMPGVEIADSIVQSGRETLEKAIMLINSTKKWGAEVVYGDTDSIFIYLQGKTKVQAFRIGNDIADTITALNPSPVKLKFEKVYLPCVLLAKKRYVGFKYEHVDDKEPVFDAKGIETVRRDGVPAQQKMTETCLKILFRSQDLSEVKDYCVRSWTKLLDNKVSVLDFIFAKEVRMGTYSENGPPPPGVVVAARRMVADPSNEPQYGERIPYVIARGLPGTRLVDRAVDPMDLLRDSRLQLDAMYYISRVLIPPLERIFNLVGADVKAWFDEMPKTYTFDPTASPVKAGKEEVADFDTPPDRLNIEEHFQNPQCLICGDYASEGLCDECYFSPQETIAALSSRMQVNEQRLMNARRICATCTGFAPGEPIECESLDCPWLFSRKRAENKEEFMSVIKEILEDVNDGGEEDDEYEYGEQTDQSDSDDMDYLFQTPTSRNE